MGLNGERERLSMMSTLRPWLLFRAQRFRLGKADAEDLVQDVFSKFWLSFPWSEGVTEQRCMGWLATTLHNTFISWLRREHLRLKVEPDPAVTELVAPEAGERPLSERISEEELSRAVERLSPKLRETWELGSQGKSHAEIAQILGIREGAVAKRIFDSRRKLRRLLWGSRR